MAIVAGDSRQSARHHAIIAAAVGEEKGAEHQRTAFEALVVPGRRMRERQKLLHDVFVRCRAKTLRPFAARVGVELGHKHRLHRRVCERRLDDPFRKTTAGVVERGGFATPPGRNGGHLERLAEQPLTERRQECQQRRRFEDAHAERVGDEHVPRAPRLHETWNPQRRIRPHLEGIAEVVVETAKDRVNRPKTRDGLQEDALVAHGQVAALDERKAKLPGKVGVLEVGLVVRPGGQHYDVRRAPVCRRAGKQELPQLVEERRQRTNAQCVKRVGQYARHDGAILECVADTRRRLCACADDPPFPVGAAREVERDQMQKDAVGRSDTTARAQEARMPVNERRRQESFAQQGLRTIQIGHDSVEQPCALSQASSKPLPLPRLHDQREDVEAPRALPSVGSRVYVVGDAVLVDLTGHPFLRLGQVLLAQLDRIGELRPRLTQRAIDGPHLVEVPVGYNVVRRQRKPCHGAVRKSNV